MSDYAAKAEDFMSKAQKKLAVRGRATGLRSRHTRSRATLDRDARVFAACARTEMCSSSRTRISRRRVVCPFSCRAPYTHASSLSSFSPPAFGPSETTAGFVHVRCGVRREQVRRRGRAGGEGVQQLQTGEDVARSRVGVRAAGGLPFEERQQTRRRVRDGGRGEREQEGERGRRDREPEASRGSSSTTWGASVSRRST